MSLSRPDVHSYARAGEPRVRHASLDLTVDFDRRVLSGSVALDLEPVPEATAVTLDTRRLQVHAVEDGHGAALSHHLGPEDPILGAPLVVALSEGTTRLVVRYETAPDAPALQWLDAAQTDGGTHPFLFTQGHAIQTRSYLPIQDSPAVRITYEARVRVPPGLVALMSAEQLGPAEDGAFEFRMREPIPPYLVALAVGAIARREVGPRTAVYAEPAMIERAAYELAEMEAMIDAAEALQGPYPFERFDVLVMPRSFPYGGMENPRLVFASPSLIVGDRSLTSVIVHELAHGWAGNLVTNATWSDFWINEGTTVYLETRLHEVLFGVERASLARRWGALELEREIRDMGLTSPDTRLSVDLSNRDPAEGVTIVPYLKGAALFYALEAGMGRPRLDAFLRDWFRRRAFQSVTSAEIVAAMRAAVEAAGVGASIDFQSWVYEPGLPPDYPVPTSALLERVEAAAHALSAGAPASSFDPSGWPPQALRHFLGRLLAASVPAATVDALREACHFGDSQNPEVLLPWLRLEIRSGNTGALPRIERFLRDQGRARYLKPLYSDLARSTWGAEPARRIYRAARPRYHALVRAGLDKLLGE